MYGGGYGGGGYTDQGHKTAGGSSEGSHSTHETVLSTRKSLADVEQKAKALYDRIEDSTEPVRDEVEGCVLDAEEALDELANVLDEGGA